MWWPEKSADVQILCRAAWSGNPVTRASREAHPSEPVGEGFAVRLFSLSFDSSVGRPSLCPADSIREPEDRARLRQSQDHLSSDHVGSRAPSLRRIRNPDSKLEEREANLVATKFVFRTNADGVVDRMSAAPDSDVKDIVFTKEVGSPSH